MKKKELNTKKEQTPMVKPFTIGDMRNINNTIIYNTTKPPVENVNMLQYITSITKHYAKTEQDIQFIKGLDEVFDNKAIYQHFYDLINITADIRSKAVDFLIKYVMNGMYLNLIHTAYAMMAYEFNLDANLDNDETKRKFISQLDIEYQRTFKQFSRQLTSFMEDAAKLTKIEVGEEEYYTMDSSSRIDYILVYTKANRSYYVDYMTTILSLALSDAVFNAMLYEEDLGQDEYEAVVDAFVPMIDTFRKDFDTLMCHFSKLIAALYVIPTKDYDYYGDF